MLHIALSTNIGVSSMFLPKPMDALLLQTGSNQEWFYNKTFAINVMGGRGELLLYFSGPAPPVHGPASHITFRFYAIFFLCSVKFPHQYYREKRIAYFAKKITDE